MILTHRTALGREFHHPARQYAKTGGVTFFAVIKEHLFTNTDAKKGLIAAG
jgi:hypothetical protein